MVATISSARVLMGNSGGKSRRKLKGAEASSDTERKRFQVVIRSEARNPERFRARNPAGFASAPRSFMANKPPPLPSEILARVLHVATLDGRLLMIVAGTLAILHAAAYQATGAIIGCLVAGAGALELHGTGMLRLGDARGMNWLVRSQLVLLAIMLIYASVKLLTPAELIMKEIHFTDELTQTLEQTGLSKLQFARLFQLVAYPTIGLVTLLYQGAMAIYYHRRRAAVSTALDDDVLAALDQTR